MINYNELLKAELQGVYGDQLKRVNEINEWYKLYDGEQGWATKSDLDYTPTKKVTNIIKKLIDKRARFMFGREPFFDVRQVIPDEGENTTHADLTQEKEDLLNKILKDNKFHNKLLKAKKDCSIGGKVAIKLWGHKDRGLKIIFSPAQEFFPEYNLDDIDKLERVVYLYALNDEENPQEQRIKKQTWELVNGVCILNEATYNGSGKIVTVEYEDYNTGLDFIPVIIIQNGGLTGETEGTSDVERLLDNQNAYNKLTSDDVDSLKFQMFGQDVITDADEDSLKNIKISPGALIDLQTDITQSNSGKQAQIQRLESRFSYKDKFADTVDRIKNDMYDTMDVPNVNLEQMRGIIQSGKSMEAIYWELMAVCDEDWTEWGSALETMVDYIFKMVDVYNLYGARTIARYETTLKIEREYPLQQDIDNQKRVDMEEVISEVRSRKEYINKWSSVEDVEVELDQIQREKAMLQDSYTQDLSLNLEE